MINQNDVLDLFEKIRKRPYLAKDLDESSKNFLIAFCDEEIEKTFNSAWERVVQFNNYNNDHFELIVPENPYYPANVSTVQEKISYWQALDGNYQKAKYVLSLVDKKTGLRTIVNDPKEFENIIAELEKERFLINGTWERQKKELALFLAKMLFSGHFNISDQRKISALAVDTFKVAGNPETIRKDLSTFYSQIENGTYQGTNHFKYIKVHESTR